MKTIILLLAIFLITAVEGQSQIVCQNGSCRYIYFINKEDGPVNDLHVRFNNYNVVMDTCWDFPNLRHILTDDDFNFWGRNIPKYDTVKVRFSGNVDLGIEKWWWTHGGTASQNGDVVGKVKELDTGSVLAWSGGPATGNGSVMVSYQGINGVFHTTPGFSPPQTAASFQAFLNNRFYVAGKNLIYSKIIYPDRVYYEGNMLGDSASPPLNVHIMTQDISQNAGFVSYSLNLTSLIEGFYDPLTNLSKSDIIEVRLRNSVAPYEVLDNSEARLDNLGHASLRFNRIMGHPVFIEVVHRNSISTWSSIPVPLAGYQSVYDFTTHPSAAYGNNLVNKGGRWCIFGGDVDQNEFVDGVDLSLVDNDVTNYVSGYVSTDVNGDGSADAADLAIVDNNTMNFVSVIRP